MWTELFVAGAQALASDDDEKSGVFQGQPSGPVTQSGAGWTVNFGKKPLDLNELSPIVWGAGLVVAGVVAIAAVRAFAR